MNGLQKITGVYLLGLVVLKGGRLVTFDHAIPVWREQNPGIFKSSERCQAAVKLMQYDWGIAALRPGNSFNRSWSLRDAHPVQHGGADFFGFPPGEQEAGLRCALQDLQIGRASC